MARPSKGAETEAEGVLESAAGDTSLAYDSHYESCDSDTDSLTEDLDQIGRFNLSRLLEYLNRDSLPNLRNLPTFSNFPNLPNLPPLPTFPHLPSAPNLPSFDLPDVSKYISQYVANVTKRANSEKDKFSLEAEERLANSLKIALATRIQMSSFLCDLRDGISLQAAIDRLQPLTDVVHEAITLPVDDESDADLEIETEPVGVAKIVNQEQPLITELVFPEARRRGPKRSKSAARARLVQLVRAESILSDEYESSVYTGSDLDHVEELTVEEARALTHLDSLEDFYKEDLLRKKIQNIQNLDNLNQRLKNKLVTKLMMGNYYKYINEKLLLEKGLSLNGHGNLLLQLHPGNLEHYVKHDKTPDDPTHTPQHNDDTDMDRAQPRKGDGSDEDDGSEGEIDDGDDEVVLSEQDQIPTYHDRSNGILGCSHYQRNCKLECPTCLEWYTCRFCHDHDHADHKLQRAEVKHVLCMKCNVPQVPDTNYCINCEEELAVYFCSKCVLYDNDPGKDIYHCDKCGICRLGLGLDKDYFHCDECNICLSIDLKEHHRCVTNTTHCNCPICNEYLFTSVSKVVFMKCGHLIHEACYDEMVKHSYKCPICKKTVVNADTQFRILDQEIRQQPLPAPYNMWRCIISCNDCKGKSNCAYHIMGLKCKYCKSYNTIQLKLIKPEEEEERGEEDVDVDNERIVSMRLIKTNLSSNFVIDEQQDKENGDAHYSSDSDDEFEEDDQEPLGNIVSFKRVTHAILGNKEVDRKSITGMFQEFINSSIINSA